MKTAEYSEIDADTLSELIKFKKQHGPQWRKKLNLFWMCDSAPGRLRHLRNTHGPSWLADFKLPKE